MKILDYPVDLLKRFFENRYWLLAVSIALYLDIVMLIYKKEIQSIADVNFQDWTRFIFLSGATVLVLPVASLTVELLILLFHYVTKHKFNDMFEDSTDYKRESGYYSRREITRYVVKTDNNFLSHALHDHDKKLEEKTEERKLWSYLFLFLNIDFFAKGETHQLIKGLDTQSNGPVVIAYIFLPLLFVIISHHYMSKRFSYSTYINLGVPLEDVIESVDSFNLQKRKQNEPHY